MPRPPAAYQPRHAERGVLYRVVEAHLDAFLDAAAEGPEGARLPAFIEQGLLLEKLAALTPRPRINLVLYPGVLAPHARWRARVVAYDPGPAARAVPPAPPDSTRKDAIATHSTSRTLPRLRRARRSSASAP